jgi:UDP-N-acetyl-D-mannosaminuronic acid dehydrogenase
MVTREEIQRKSCKIGIIGLGYVGLPMATVLANRGYTVLGGDISSAVVEKVNSGQTPVNEAGLQRMLAEAVSSGRLKATLDTGRVARESDIIIVVVQTPIDEDKKPDLSYLEKALETVAENLHKEKLVIIESTIPPGTTKHMVVPILQNSGLVAGGDFYLAYSPERAMPTKTLEEIQKNDRIVGGINEESALLAEALYSNVTSGDVITTDIATAEIVKVIENTYRDVNIALANEIAILCERLGVDAIKAIKLANRHPRVNIHMPGPGVGGHCVPKDPYFLISKADELGVELKVITSARKVNEAMPKHMLRIIEKALKGVNKRVEDAKVAVLGIAYKGNTDDIRGTPSKEIIEGLMKANCEVFSHDPFVSQDFGGKFSNDLNEVARDADCLVILTDHDLYKKLDLKKLSKMLRKPGVVVDGRRILDPRIVEGEGLRYFGVGL